jgi:hypothetical protein
MEHDVEAYQSKNRKKLLVMNNNGNKGLDP